MGAARAVGRSPVQIVPEVRQCIVGDDWGCLSGCQDSVRHAGDVESGSVKGPLSEGGESSHHIVRGQSDLLTQPGGYERRLERANVSEALEG